jgi:hypothetical protein
MSAINCVVPGCKARMAAQMASVPELAAIRKAAGKPVTVAELGKHTICGRHTRDAREAGVKVYPYLATVKMLEQRTAERAATGKFFQVYAALDRATAPPSSKPSS